MRLGPERAEARERGSWPDRSGIDMISARHAYLRTVCVSRTCNGPFGYLTSVEYLSQGKESARGKHITVRILVFPDSRDY